MFECYSLQEPPKLTVREARKLLGRKYSHKDDTQIQEIIITLTLIARKQLGISGSKKA